MKYKITKLEPFGALIESAMPGLNIGELNIEVIRELFLQEQLVLIRGFQGFANSDAFSKYCEQFGEISIWPFGKVLELVQQDEPLDHIFDNSYVPLHWDGMYRTQVPEYQIFHCVKAPSPGQGGRTIFSNTIKVLENLSQDMRENWKSISGIYKRKMEFYNSKIISPLITRHPYRNYDVIRYNEVHNPDRGKLINIPDISFTGLKEKELVKVFKDLNKFLYNSKSSYAHEWRDADIVIADNFTLLHGREAFKSNAPRHIQRVQVLSNPPFDNPHLETLK
ncbi:MAG: pyoverdine biosynthesis protein PvcB [Peredibacter sp.]|nr:pyoverdine biosynthesis protein PvcB [Peredibacter sp.]